MATPYYYTNYTTNLTILFCGDNYAWQCDCSTISADPDIAGIGVLIAFSVSALLTLACSSISICMTPSDELNKNYFDWFVVKLCGLVARWTRKILGSVRKASSAVSSSGKGTARYSHDRNFWRKVLERVVLALSDTQLITGFAILLAALIRYFNDKISVYHFSVVMDLAWLASNTHITSLTVIRDYQREYFWARTFRTLFMLPILIAMLGYTILQGNAYWDVDVFPNSYACSAPCLMQGCLNTGGVPENWMIADIVLLVVYYFLGILSMWPELQRLWDRWERWMKTIGDTSKDYREIYTDIVLNRVLVLSVLLSLWWPVYVVLAIFCLIMSLFFGLIYITLWLINELNTSYIFEILFDYAWFGFSMWCLIEDKLIGAGADSYLMASEQKAVEMEWGFGQLLPVILLALPLFSTIEVLNEERKDWEEKGKEASSIQDSISSAPSISTSQRKSIEHVQGSQDSSEPRTGLRNDHSSHEPEPGQIISADTEGDMGLVTEAERLRQHQLGHH